jgi:hypothetical protein
LPELPLQSPQVGNTIGDVTHVFIQQRADFGAIAGRRIAKIQ